MDRLQQIAATQPLVDGWVRRGAVAEEPQPSAELAEDDKIWPDRRVSETARLALLASSEHLQLVCETVAGQRGYVTATHTVLRGALLGAVTSVWLLGSDDPLTRQQRGLRQIATWYRRKEQYDLALRAVVSSDERLLLNRQAKFSASQRRKVQALWTSAPGLTDKETPKDTKVVDEVAAYLFANEPFRAESLRLYWSELSGDAHALGWQLVGRRTSPLLREPGGHRITTSQANIKHIADPYLAAFTVLKRGWSLFDQRCTSP